jgi:hypothetical protein
MAAPLPVRRMFFGTLIVALNSLSPVRQKKTFFLQNWRYVVSTVGDTTYSFSSFHSRRHACPSSKSPSPLIDVVLDRPEEPSTTPKLIVEPVKNESRPPSLVGGQSVPLIVLPSIIPIKCLRPRCQNEINILLTLTYRRRSRIRIGMPRMLQKRPRVGVLAAFPGG